MRALFGLRPRSARRRPRTTSSRRSASTRATTCCRSCAGRGTPFSADAGGAPPPRRADLRRDRRRRARPGERGEDVLSLLLDATDEDGSGLSDAAHPRRGHDAAVRGPRHDDLDGRVPVLRARAPPRATRGDRPRPGARRDAAPVPARVDRPAPRRSRRSSLRARASRRRRPSTTARGPATGCPTCGRSPSASTRSASRPGRRETIPKGAYVPFGGGSRICMGMRFGQAEIGVIARRILARLGARAAAGLRAARPPDADDRPPRRDADGRACRRAA